MRLTAAIVLSALLAAGGVAHPPRAQQPEDETLTAEERREAGEFLLRLDERWREARDFGALFDEAFVADFAELSRTDPDSPALLALDASLRARLTAAELRRAQAAYLDLVYVRGRLEITLGEWRKSRRAEKRAAAPARTAGAEPSGEAAETEEASAADVVAAALAEESRSSPVLSAAFAEGGGENAEAGEEFEITTRRQLDEVLSALERATPKLRARVKGLEAELGGAPVSAVEREDEGEGEWPELQLSLSEAESKNRPAGTRVVVANLSLLQVLLVKEGGRYKVLAAYVLGN